MKWRTKARIQNAIAKLPPSASYELYYRVQRTGGALRRPVPLSRLSAGVATWRRLVSAGVDPRDRVFLEVGTGRVPLVPIALWLLGADRTLTLDLNPYLKQPLIRDHLSFIHTHPDEVATLFGDDLDEGRFSRLLALAGRSAPSTGEVLELCRIDYRAPADAAKTGLPEATVDFQTSYTTFEHIPRPVLHAILEEGVRILRPAGMLVHRIDYTDHFSHSDNGISAINFLRFSAEDWERLAGNRYMYMNRLRHDDFVELFEGVGLQLVAVEPDVDEELRALVTDQQVVLAPPFSAKSVETLATTAGWFVAAPPAVRS